MIYKKIYTTKEELQDIYDQLDSLYMLCDIDERQTLIFCVLNNLDYLDLDILIELKVDGNIIEHKNAHLEFIEDDSEELYDLNEEFYDDLKWDEVISKVPDFAQDCFDFNALTYEMKIHHDFNVESDTKVIELHVNEEFIEHYYIRDYDSR